MVLTAVWMVGVTPFFLLCCGGCGLFVVCLVGVDILRVRFMPLPVGCFSLVALVDAPAWCLVFLLVICFFFDDLSLGVIGG